MRTKAEIVNNWLPRYTGRPLGKFGRYILLSNFGHYISRFAERFDVEILGQDKPMDLFGLRRRYAFLAPLLDAEYGSATFMPVAQPAELELRVSTTGLLMRETTPSRSE